MVPRHLTKESKRIWRRIAKHWELEETEQVLLKVALEAYDRLQSARQKIADNGETYKTETGYVRENPLLKIEKEARSGFLQAWRMLDLGIDPPKEVGRPATKRELEFGKLLDVEPGKGRSSN